MSGTDLREWGERFKRAIGEWIARATPEERAALAKEVRALLRDIEGTGA